jgi:hypothetical protein
MQPQPNPRADLVCRCGLTFEPLPWFDAELDEPLCDECADGE